MGRNQQSRVFFFIFTSLKKQSRVLTYMSSACVTSDEKLRAWVGLHTVNTKRYDTGTGETVPVVAVSLTVKRYL